MNHFDLNVSETAPKNYMPSTLPFETTESIDRYPTLKQVTFTGLGLTALGFAIFNLPAITSVGEHKTTIEPTNSIESVSIAEDARVRENPAVEDNTDSNLIDVIEAPIDITTADGVRVLTGTVDGTWYGINSADLAASIPNFSDHNDADGVVWINGQTIVTQPETTKSQ